MKRTNARPQSPAAKPSADGVSPELLELVLRFLRRKYGERPLLDYSLYSFGYHLGCLEREYCKEPEKTAISRVAP